MEGSQGFEQKEVGQLYDFYFSPRQAEHYKLVNRQSAMDPSEERITKSFINGKVYTEAVRKGERPGKWNDFVLVESGLSVKDVEETNEEW